MKALILLTALLMCTQADVGAQEHTGHGRQSRPRRNQQQQQQAKQSFQKRVVVRGAQAEKLYLEAEKSNQAKDISDHCSESVISVESRNAVCFDRGEDFTRGSRYKCYVETQKTISGLRSMIFDLTHNSCGGDGIHPKKVH